MMMLDRNNVAEEIRMQLTRSLLLYGLTRGISRESDTVLAHETLPRHRRLLKLPSETITSESIKVIGIDIYKTVFH